MTIRKRIKQKWQHRLGDFEFKKATYHPNKSKSFEVWHKQNLLGYCTVGRLRQNLLSESLKNLPEFIHLEKNPVTTHKIFDKIVTNTYNVSEVSLGNVYSTGAKNGFPANIIYVELFPEKLDLVAERYVIIEKEGHFNGVTFLSPGVYTREND